MRTGISRLSALAVLLVASMAVAQTPPRTWTSLSGATVEAAFVEAPEGVVVLQTGDGRQLRIPVDQLAEKDRKLVKSYEARRVRFQENMAPNQLPAFFDGPHRLANAVYQHDRFDAIVHRNGALIVYPKDETGQRIGTPFTAAHLACYYSLRGPRGRPVVRFDEPPPPALQPQRVELKGLLKDDVAFELTYEFHDNRVTAFARATDPKGQEYDTILRVGTSFSQGLQIDNDVELYERQRLLEGYELRTVEQPAKGGKEEKSYEYWDNPKFSGDIVHAEIVGPWGSRKVVYSTDLIKAGRVRPYVYTGRALNERYSLFYVIESKKSELRAYGDRVVVAIE